MEWFSYTAKQTSVLLVMILGDIYFVIAAVHVVHLHLGSFFSLTFFPNMTYFVLQG